MACPQLYHYKAARRTLIYLRDTKHLGIRYSQEDMIKQRNILTATTDDHITDIDGENDLFDQFLKAAVDASFADCLKTFRSTSGFVIWFGGSPVDWECKRQALVTLSTMESEYVAASKCVNSIRFLHKLMKFLDIDRQGPTAVDEDNSACISISTKTVHKSRSKHIGTKYHSVREACRNGEVTLVQVWTEHQVADIFTKSLKPADFIRCRETLMGRVMFNDMVAAHPKPQPTASQGKGTGSVSLQCNCTPCKSTSTPYQYDNHNIDVKSVNSHGTITQNIWPKQSFSNHDTWVKSAPGPNCISLRHAIMGTTQYNYPGHVS